MVATVARGWLPVFTYAVAGKTAASQASFKFDKNKSISFAEKGFNVVYMLWILVFHAKLNDQLTHSDHRQSLL